jgi:hypothetical protein
MLGSAATCRTNSNATTIRNPASALATLARRLYRASLLYWVVGTVMFERWVAARITVI